MGFAAVVPSDPGVEVKTLILAMQVATKHADKRQLAYQDPGVNVVFSVDKNFSSQSSLNHTSSSSSRKGIRISGFGAYSPALSSDAASLPRADFVPALRDPSEQFPPLAGQA
jgi:hypothetical protein